MIHIIFILTIINLAYAFKMESKLSEMKPLTAVKWVEKTTDFVIVVFVIGSRARSNNKACCVSIL